MPGKLAAAFPGRAVHGTGDAAFHGESLVAGGTTWTTRLPVLGEELAGLDGVGGAAIFGSWAARLNGKL